MATPSSLVCASITGRGFGLGHWAVGGRAGGLHEQLTVQSTIVFVPEVHLIGEGWELNAHAPTTPDVNMGILASAAVGSS